MVIVLLILFCFLPLCTYPFFLERLAKTVDIETSTVEIEERGVKLKLTVVDTPGFGDSLDNSEWYEM